MKNIFLIIALIILMIDTYVYTSDNLDNIKISKVGESCSRTIGGEWVCGQGSRSDNHFIVSNNIQDQQKSKHKCNKEAVNDIRLFINKAAHRFHDIFDKIGPIHDEQ